MFSSVCAHSGNTSSSSASEVELWPPHPHYIALVLHTQLNSRAETQDRRRHNGQDVRGGGCMEIRCFTSLSSSRPDASPFEDQSFPRIRGFLPPSRQIYWLRHSCLEIEATGSGVRIIEESSGISAQLDFQTSSQPCCCIERKHFRSLLKTRLL